MRPAILSSVSVSPRQPYDLGQAGDPGLDPVAGGVAPDLLHERGIERDRMGARSDQRHVAPDDVPQLRQLVQAGAAQPAPDRSDAPVVGARLHERRAGLMAHGAKLEQLEHVVAEALTRLAEQGGTGRVQPDRERQSPPATARAATSMTALPPMSRARLTRRPQSRMGWRWSVATGTPARLSPITMGWA